MRISAKTGEGLDELCGILEQIIRSRRVHLEKVYPYSQAGRIQTIRKYGQLLKEEYTEDGSRWRRMCRPSCLENCMRIRG